MTSFTLSIWNVPLFLVLSLSQTSRAADFAALKALPIDGRLTEQMNRFGNGRLGATYLNELAENLRGQMIDQSLHRLPAFRRDDCTPSLSAQFMEPGFADPQHAAPASSLARDFESGFLRIEAVACLPDATPDHVIAVTKNPAFRLEAIKELSKSIASGPQSICENSKPVRMFLGETRTCSEFHTFADATEGLNLSTITFNDGGKDFQTVYYRESLTLVVRQTNRTALYFISYARVKTPGWGSGIAEGRVEESQKHFYETLNDYLK